MITHLHLTNVQYRLLLLQSQVSIQVGGGPILWQYIQYTSTYTTYTHNMINISSVSSFIYDFFSILDEYFKLNIKYFLF